MTGEVENKCFKSQHKFLVKSGCKKRMWRSLKQILVAERALPWSCDAVLYYSINAPPTFKPTKKYSEISGLPAPYVDRHSKLYYSSAEEFATVRSLPMDITAGTADIACKLTGHFAACDETSFSPSLVDQESHDKDGEKLCLVWVIK